MTNLTPLLPTNLDHYAWENAFIVLSLHGAMEFWSGLGLSSLCADDLRSKAEKVVRGLRAIDQVGLEGDTWVERRVHWLRQAATELFATKDGGVVAGWFKCVALRDRQEMAQASLWASAWRARATSGAPELRLAPELSASVLRLIERYLDWSKDFTNRVVAAADSPGSDWDVEVTANYLEDCSPYDWVLNVGLFAQFAAVWRDVERLLNEEEIGCLMEWTVQLGLGQEIELELIQRPHRCEGT